MNPARTVRVYQANSSRTYDAVLCRSPICDRQACTASEEGYAEYCCRNCAESGQHSESCNSIHAELKKRRVTPS